MVEVGASAVKRAFGISQTEINYYAVLSEENEKYI